MDQSPQSYQPLLRVVIAAAGGIILDRLLGTSLITWLVLIPIGFAFWTIALKRNWLRLSSVSLLATVLVLGAAWHNLNWNVTGATDIATFADLDSRPVYVRGRVASQPKWIAPDKLQELYSRERGIRSRLLVRIDAIRDDQEFRKASGKVELFVEGQVTGLVTGDQIEFAGNLSQISPVSNPGEFDLKAFFRGKQTHCWMNVSSPECISKTSSGNPISRLASSTRVALDALLWKYLPHDTAPLASAMLLGNRDQLDRVARDSFMLSGTIHLLAISGLHVGILAGLILLIPRIGLLSRRKGLLLTIGFVCLYAWLVEFRPPVTRAAILISVFCYCRWIGRTPFSFNSLALAALVVLAVNPMELFGVGAQLSFLAVGTLIYARHWLAPPRSDDPVDRLIENTRPWNERLLRYLGSRMYLAFAVSAVIWLFAIPAVACQFHIVAPIALIANPLLLIPVTIGLVCGLGVLAFGFWLPPAAHVLATGCDGSLSVIRTVVQASESVPYGHWWTCGPPLTAVLCFYAVLIVAYLRLDGLPFRHVVCGWLIWIVAGWMLPAWHHDSLQRKRDSFQCTIIDVGHGGCVLLQLPKGKNVLYDCGSFGSPRNAQQTAAAVLWNQRVRHLDAVVISHADSDHFNGLPMLAHQFSIGQVIVSECFCRKAPESAMVQSFIDEMARLEIPVSTVQEGDHLNFCEDTTLNVLSPPAEGFGTSDNANSIVLDVEYQGRRILLPGDLEREGLDRLLSGKEKKYDAVMAPHHGSHNSRPEEFFAWCRPDFVIASCRRGKNLGLIRFMPGDSAGNAGTVLHTGYDGAVKIEISESGLAVRSWMNKPW